MPTPSSLRRHTLALLCVIAAACGSADATSGPNSDPTGAYVALPECGPMPEPGDVGEVEGLQLPEGAVVFDVVEQGPLTSVQAEAPGTPVAIRVAFEARDDLELLHSEDEVFEAELLVSDGTHRTALKATAICQDRSLLTLHVAPEAAIPDGGLPGPGPGTTPAG